MTRTTRTGEVIWTPTGETLGRVWKVQGGWRNDLASTVYPNQGDARNALLGILEARGWKRVR